MSYRNTFDHLGNPVYQSAEKDWQHRVIRWGTVITIAACAAIMLWGR